MLGSTELLFQFGKTRPIDCSAYTLTRNIPCSRVASTATLCTQHYIASAEYKVAQQQKEQAVADAKASAMLELARQRLHVADVERMAQESLLLAEKVKQQVQDAKLKLLQDARNAKLKLLQEARDAYLKRLKDTQDAKLKRRQDAQDAKLKLLHDARILRLKRRQQTTMAKKAFQSVLQELSSSSSIPSYIAFRRSLQSHLDHTKPFIKVVQSQPNHGFPLMSLVFVLLSTFVLLLTR